MEAQDEFILGWQIRVLILHSLAIKTTIMWEEEPQALLQTKWDKL